MAVESLHSAEQGTGVSPAWGEKDSQVFIDLGRVFTPGRDEICDAFIHLLPVERDESFTVVDIACGQAWLSEAILRAYPRARVVALDGSETMLSMAVWLTREFPGRITLQGFRFEDEVFEDQIEGEVHAFVSSLAIHHLDAPGKQRLFQRLHRRLAAGGALLICDLIQPQHKAVQRYFVKAWDAITKQLSLAQTGSLVAYEQFLREEWNYYVTMADPIDQPSPLSEQLTWLAQAGFESVDAFWLKAGHAIYGGYKSGF